MFRNWLVGETRPIQCSEQPIARAVTGEHPPGPITSVGGGSQPDHQQPGFRIAKPGNRPRPVILALKPCRGVASTFLPPVHQPGTFEAGGYLGLNFCERVSA